MPQIWIFYFVYARLCVRKRLLSTQLASSVDVYFFFLYSIMNKWRMTRGARWDLKTKKKKLYLQNARIHTLCVRENANKIEIYSWHSRAEYIYCHSIVCVFSVLFCFVCCFSLQRLYARVPLVCVCVCVCVRASNWRIIFLWLCEVLFVGFLGCSTSIRKRVCVCLAKFLFNRGTIFSFGFAHSQHSLVHILFSTISSKLQFNVKESSENSRKNES